MLQHRVYACRCVNVGYPIVFILFHLFLNSFLFALECFELVRDDSSSAQGSMRLLHPGARAKALLVHRGELVYFGISEPQAKMANLHSIWE